MIISISSSQAQIANLSQLTHDYQVGKFKGYATKQLVNTKDSFVAAGTYFDLNVLANDPASIHIMKTGPEGFLNYTNAYKESIIPRSDLRVISLVGDENSEDKFVISQSRGTPNFTIPDQIGVLQIDGNGQVLQSIKITSSSVFNGNTYSNAYPLGALFYNDGLYICGYVTNNSTAYPADPDWGPKDTKMAFVVRLDASPGSTFNVTASRTYDWFSNHPAANSDFDKATRMQVLNNGNLWITGCENFEIGSPTSMATFSGGIMNLEVDPSTLVPVVNGYRGFRANGYTSFPIVEEGIALVENATESVIIGNTYMASSSNGTYDPQEIRTNFSVVSLNLDAVLVGQNQIVRNVLSPGNPGNWVQQASASPVNLGSIRLAGAHFDNGTDRVTPYFADISVTSGLLQANLSINDWFDFPAYTGNATAVNSYFLLGGPLSHPLFQPEAGELNYTIGLKPPFIVNPQYYQYDLRPKIVREDLTPLSDCFIELSNPPLNYIDMIDNSTFIVTNNQVGDFPIYTVDIDVVPLQPLDYILCAEHDPTLPRPGGSSLPNGRQSEFDNKFNNLGSLEIFPNPASTLIKINGLSTLSSDQHLDVQLMDLQGRDLGKLFQGISSQIPANGFELPNLAKGMYLIKINISGTISITKKLIIQ